MCFSLTFLENFGFLLRSPFFASWTIINVRIGIPLFSRANIPFINKDVIKSQNDHEFLALRVCFLFFLIDVINSLRVDED